RAHLVPARGGAQDRVDGVPRSADRGDRRLRAAGFVLKRALSLALAATIACAPVRAQLPTLGSGGELSIGAERKMGEQVARELYRDPDYIEDPILDEYVLGIWNRLLATARARGD